MVDPERQPVAVHAENPEFESLACRNTRLSAYTVPYFMRYYPLIAITRLPHRWRERRRGHRAENLVHGQ